MSFRKKFIGDRAFYKMVVALIIPLIVQQGITNFVNLLDNVMVGGLGTASISAVAIVNQLIFIFNLTIFGGLSGAAIFGAQFFGVGDHKGLRETFRFKLIFGLITAVVAIGVFLFYGEGLVSLFLNQEANGGEEIAQTLALAKDYMGVMLWGLVPFMVVQVYAGTLRETGETVAPMVASVIAIVLNLAGNYLLIYGHLGLPKMGVMGAAVATVISRYVEMVYVVAHTHRHPDKYPFIVGVYKSLHVSASLVKKIAVTGTPLMVNEVLWSLGMTLINQSYSTRGLTVVASININATAWQLFCVMMFAMGNAVAILVGQQLGAGNFDEAKRVDTRLIFLTVVMHVAVGLLVIACAPVIPLLYDTEPQVRSLATQLLTVAGASLPIHAFVHVAYFTIRSGGKTLITFFFDCVYTWLVPVPLCFFLCRMTGLPVIWIYFCIQFIDIIKVIIGAIMLRSGFWAKNVIGETKAVKAAKQS